MIERKTELKKFGFIFRQHLETYLELLMIVKGKN